jgi:hypothetical protein
MRINHEETKNTKKDQKDLRALRFFVVDFRRRGYVRVFFLSQAAAGRLGGGSDFLSPSDFAQNGEWTVE